MHPQFEDKMPRFAGAPNLASVFILVLAVVTVSSAKTLVILESETQKTTHSDFLSLIPDADIRLTSDAAIQFKTFDQFHHDALILLSKSLPSSMDIQTIASFIDSGHNVLLAASSPSASVRDVAGLVGVKFDSDGSVVTDHFHYASSLGQDHTLVAADGIFDSPALLGDDRLPGPVLFRGTALLVPRHAELVVKALVAPDTAFSASSRRNAAASSSSSSTIVAGQMATLVAMAQARNNARVTLLGSLDMLGNDLFRATSLVTSDKKTHKQSGNRVFAQAVLSWTLQRRGVLTVQNVRHTVLSGAPATVGQVNPSLYRINDHVSFEMDIFETRDGKVVPYDAQQQQVQIEFTMLDPHVRKTLTPDGKGTFRTVFQVPDVYGAFKYVVKYTRAGYSRIEFEMPVNVRPFKHDEYDRFLWAAMPYYASSFSMMAGFFLCGVLFLYHK